MKKWIALALALTLLFTGCQAENEEPAERKRSAATEKKSVSFPLELIEGGIVVERLQVYSGEYWENGEAELVEDVAAILVRNPGRRSIEFAAITLKQGTKRLHFFLYDLPPGETCLVMEKEKQCGSGSVEWGEILSIRWSVYDLAPEQVQWVGIEERIHVRNVTGQEIEDLCIRYKRYCQEFGCYLGGISFSAHAMDLGAGEEQILTPGCYHAGTTKVVGINAEGT